MELSYGKCKAFDRGASSPPLHTWSRRPRKCFVEPFRAVTFGQGGFFVRKIPGIASRNQLSLSPQSRYVRARGACTQVKGHDFVQLVFVYTLIVRYEVGSARQT